MITPGTWQPQLGTWHNQPVTQTPTWDRHQFSCQTEIRTRGPWRAWVGATQAQGPADGSPGSHQFSKTFSVLCISSKTLGRRLSNGQKWFQDCRLTFPTPHTISISFKTVGVGEDVKTRSFRELMARQPRTAFPSWLPPHLQEQATLLGIHVVI